MQVPETINNTQIDYNSQYPNTNTINTSNINTQQRNNNIPYINFSNINNKCLCQIIKYQCQ